MAAALGAVPAAVPGAPTARVAVVPVDVDAAVASVSGVFIDQSVVEVSVESPRSDAERTGDLERMMGILSSYPALEGPKNCYTPPANGDAARASSCATNIDSLDGRQPMPGGVQGSFLQLITRRGMPNKTPWS